MSPAKALVVGYGSIGARHARLLCELGCETAVVSSRDIGFPATHASLAAALAASQPQYVIIANATHLHHGTLFELAQHGYSGTALVEKPLFHRELEVPPQLRANTWVAYNLRFHPLIQRLRTLLQSQNVLTAHVYVGQYLPDWRPARDYRASYSANTDHGGGVLRDLSHELDYLTWMFGGWQRVVAVGGKLSELQIESDDVFALLLVTPACPVVSLQVNYLDRTGRRSMIINTDRHTIEVDLVRSSIVIDRNGETLSVERDHTYRAMHEQVLAGRRDSLCSVAEGLEVMKLIAAAEQSVEYGEWIER